MKRNKGCKDVTWHDRNTCRRLQRWGQFIRLTQPREDICCCCARQSELVSERLLYIYINVTFKQVVSFLLTQRAFAARFYTFMTWNFSPFGESTVSLNSPPLY